MEGPMASISLAPAPAATAGCGSGSRFAHVQQAPEDPIYGVTNAFLKDPSPVKVNLGVGAYRTEEGKPLVLNVVRKAEEQLLADKSRNKEYLPISGITHFSRLSAQLILGSDCPAIAEKRIVTAQCLSGTGCLRVGGEFLAKHYSGPKIIYIPATTWTNHFRIFPNAGMEARTYRYYDPKTKGLDYEGMMEDLRAAPSGAVVLLHACAHNPTGVDPTREQWAEIQHLVRDEKQLLPFFDSAYQGFASGSLDADAWAVRQFVNDGGETLVAQSYAKNMGLYGERVGALSVIVKDPDVALRIESQVNLVIRPMYSSPPTFGAAIVCTILGNKALYEEWKVELKGMADRIISMRHQLFDALKARATPGTWDHIVNQIGMFTYSGLSKEQVEYMKTEYHIHMTSDGRISMAGLNTRTVPQLADAIHAAVLQFA
ncbi:aspartate aminotransferase, cytoplasmic [Marchantia polymorpha subsp. ruderalis]|nr:hypothetical protein MARPO_0015s0092 [Marchantia polymorpha]BBN01519.1 hypothetical protein Mp_2g08050 [Marchantia polymorpha subsp. ruderalis]|eukprot:PTQ45288.1 hypothetical protein MARPO_0015s0092 [Marchantia polymorpha]